MAQLLLTAASGVGAAVGKAGVGAFLAKTVATTAASYAAGYVDRLIFGPAKRKVEGPRLESFQVQASQEGAPILRVYGRARVAGQLIWAANFKETISETTERVGGKGARPAAETTYTEYLYSISFAVGLCEGEIDRVGRVWADGKLLDLSTVNMRVYQGTPTQTPDALIEATEGDAPAFRGLAYVVFEDLALKDFGNRIPQLAFEVEKSLKTEDPDALENRLTAVTIIPGSGEFVYGTTPVTRNAGEGVTRSENVHNGEARADFPVAMDALEAAAPGLAHTSLVVSWFGSSTDVAACALRPGVEVAEKETAPYPWFAGGVARESAHLISTLNDAPAYGGTPADRSVREAIADLKARGLTVQFHPFILMDAPGFPWRGRVDAGANDKTAAARAGVDSFFGVAAPGDFAVQNGEVIYTGPAEWSFRRMILHYAHLCAAAGGVDAFLLGSELRGITTIRDETGAYPAVAKLTALASDVRSILGAQTELSYGADWSEYFGHQPADGSGDVFFHLDDLWASADIDFIGIDNYMPLGDWRDGFGHLDALAGAPSPYDRDYLKSRIAGGEGFDWYYASAADREAQIRTPITDGAYGEPWVYRVKDLVNWWSNAHHNRPGGARSASATSWVPRSKPIVFTETGAPAVDKGANQPNVFLDPKSSESAAPFFSNRSRDDLAQRSVLEAQAAYWADPANNPTSAVYGAPMVRSAQQYVYAYDARPFPFFPALSDVWGDGANWATGHWLNGRLGRAPLSLLVKALAAEADVASVNTAALTGVIAGYVVDRPLSPRETIDPLADIFQFDAIEAGDIVRFQPRAMAPALTFDASELAARDDGAFTLALGQASDLPAAFRLGFIDEGTDYGPAVAEARDPGAAPTRETGAEIAAVMAPELAEARARSILADAWVMRESLSFSLPPSALSLEPGDGVVITDLGVDRRYRVTDIDDGAARETASVRLAPSVYDAPAAPASFTVAPPPPVYGAPVFALFETPLLRDDDTPGAPWFAAFADPWPGGVALYRAGQAGAPILSGRAPARAIMGRLKSALPPGPTGRWDNRSVDVVLSFGSLQSREAADVFAGANLCAIESANGGYEVLQFASADLTDEGAWRLAGLLRGQGGGEARALTGAAIGARFVLITPAVTQTSLPAGARGIAYDWLAGPEEDLPVGQNFALSTETFSGLNLTPLSPVHLRAVRVGDDLALSWIRRTRAGGDGWETEVPLAEQSERYRLRILDGATLIREAETAAPAFPYTAAMIQEDFGPQGPGPNAGFEVAQRSDAVGEGFWSVRGGL